MGREIPYVVPTEDEVKEMLKEIGVKDVDELYSDIPSKYLLERFDFPSSKSEIEVKEIIKEILSKNKCMDELKLFIGGGAWPHYIPSAVKEIASRSEFLTSYTPYQPEVSQGILQALFEYQSLLAELLEIDVVNASMYDWATALGEAFRMAARVTGRKKILYPHYISPQRREVASTYSSGMRLRLEDYMHLEDGSVDVEDLQNKLDRDVAAIYIEYPSYLGFITKNIKTVGELAHESGALFIVGVDPSALGILEAPGRLGADIVVGEGQPLGLPMSFGGPLLGILGCRLEPRLLHSLPGRLIGMTKTLRDDERAYCMILQSREQHIKREKATSNICTNQALCAVMVAAYLSLLGKNGFIELGRQILARTNYMIKKLSEISGVNVPLFDAPHFKEFAYRVDGYPSNELLRKLLERGIVGGIDLSREFEELGNSILTCVTEIHSKQDIDQYVNTVKEVVER